MTDTTNSLKDQPFNKELNRSVPEIMDKYVALISEYYAFIGEKKNITHKKQYAYLLARGLDTITHVFTMILFYTKNLELTYYHSQKSFYFYVEFIEQILDVQHTFLHLSSRDASIFVYKKTIYEINPEFRKEVENTHQNESQFALCNSYIQIYKQIPPVSLVEIHTRLISRQLTLVQLEKVYNAVSAYDVEDGDFDIDIVDIFD